MRDTREKDVYIFTRKKDTLYQGTELQWFLFMIKKLDVMITMQRGID